VRRRFTRLAASAAFLLVTGCLADALLLLTPAGATLGPLEALALVALAGSGVAAAAVGGRSELLLVPIAALVVFQASLGAVVPVPRDAVIRDAQAGIAVVVVLAGQLLAVGAGVALGRRRDPRRP